MLIDILELARARLSYGNQAAVTLTPAAVELTSGEMELRPSQVLPGQMILPLAWPVNEQHNHPSQKE